MDWSGTLVVIVFAIIILGLVPYLVSPNNLMVLAFLILGGFLLYSDYPWLAVVMFALALVAFIYDYGKDKKNQLWEEFKNADSSYPEGKMEKYVKNASRMGTDAILTGETKKYSTDNVLAKIDNGATSFFKELNEVFKR